MSEEKKDELQPKVEEEVKDTQEQPAVEETKIEEEPKVEETPVEQPKVEEEKVEETPAPQEEIPDAPIVIDNTAEPPVQPIQELPRTAKLKEPMSKNKKIAIVVISVIAFIAIFSIVFFPLYFCYFQGRIHIYDEEDFVAAANKRFVLEKDIVVTKDLNLAGSTCSIDLNGHNLTVDGTLYVGAPDTTINVGTLKKNAYTSKGLVTVNNLVVTGKDTNFASAIVSKGSIKVTANNVTFNTVSAVNEAFFNVNTVVFNGSFSISSEATSIEFKDCQSVVFGAEVNGNTVRFESSNVVFNKPAVGHNFVLDNLSTLVAYGKLDSITGGKKVAMLQGHSCAKYTDVALLAIYNASEDVFTATGCEKLVYVETLPSPVDLMVSEEGGVFKAVCAKVDGYVGIKYQFSLDDTKYDATTDNFKDITADLKAAGAATHTVKVSVLGNFNFDTLSADAVESGDTLYLDCEEPTLIDYSYTLKLATPTNVEMKDDVGDGIIYLSFAEVDFADYYVVTIDGANKYILTTDLTPEEFIAIHASVANEYGNNVIQVGQNGAALTEQLSTLGYHSLRLVACSFSKEIETSKETMTSYKTVKQISLLDENITATSTLQADGSYLNTITIANCENGKLFKIVVDGKEYRVSNSTYSFTSEASLVGKNVQVTAEAYGYFTESVTRTVVFVEA